MKQGINANYRFLNQQMGSGNHSRITQALNIKTQERVAIKILSPELFKDNKQRAETLIKEEIEILSRCKNQNIIRYIEHFEQKNKIYLVLELADETLEKYVQRVQPKEAECVEIIKQIGSGIHYLHQTAKAIHRDIRPQNVMIKGEVWKILDLGFSKGMNNEGQLFSSNFGTNYSTAPEILEAKRYNFKVDIWSLGILFYAMLYRKYPFALQNPLQNLNNMKNQTIQFLAGPSQTAINFIKGCLKYNPDQRFNWTQFLNHALFKRSVMVNIQDLSFLILNKKEQNGEVSYLTKKQFQSIYSEKDRENYYKYIEVLEKILLIRNKISLYHQLFIKPAQKFLNEFYDDNKKFECLLIPLIQASFYIKEIIDIDDGSYCKIYKIDAMIQDKGQMKHIKLDLAFQSKIIKRDNVQKYYTIKEQKSKIKSNYQFNKQSKKILESLDEIITTKILNYTQKLVEIKQISTEEFTKSIDIIKQKLLKIQNKIKLNNDIKLFQLLLGIIEEIKKKENGCFLESLIKREDLRNFESKFKLQ